MKNIDKKAIKFKYKNYRNEVSTRHVVPKQIWYGSTEWHKKEQWLMTAYDLDKDAERDFALIDIIKFV